MRMIVPPVLGFLLAAAVMRAQDEGLLFVPVTPCRVVDTRAAGGPFGGPTMAGGSTRSFAIPQSACGIPPTAQAYSLNVTVVPKGSLSYLTLWPTGQTQPLVSTLNSWGGIVVANAAIVPAGTGGAVSVYVTNLTDVILDINGYFDTSNGPTSYAFYPATPCRVADTRGAAGTFGGPSMYGGQSRPFPIPLSSCNIPATARAYSLNVTVVPNAAAHYLGYLTCWPTGQSQPNVSTLNSWTGKVVANAALVPAGSNESISVFVSNPTDVILDIDGYFAAPGSEGALLFYPVPPCRVADTRNANGPFGGPIVGAQTTRSFAIPSSACDIPSTAAAYSLNVTVVPPGPLSYLTVWPDGSAQPYVSTLNSWDGAVVANAAIVPAGTGGVIDVFATNATQVILDINGYFAAPGGSSGGGPTSFDLTVNTSGDGTGTMYSQNLSGGDHLGTGSCGSGCYIFPAGTVLQLTAQPSTGSVFGGWSGACSGTGACNLTMNANQSVTAAFLNANDQFHLTVSYGGTGSGTIYIQNLSGGNDLGTSCGQRCFSYPAGTVLALTETAASGSFFAGWSGACSGGGTCNLTMVADQSVIGAFDLGAGFTLAVTENGTGSGTVTSSPAGIACGATCSASYASGTQVSLNAAANPASVFVGWSGGGCSGNAACTVPMNGNQAVAATFNAASSFVLTVSKSGTGAGTVTSSPSGISCGPACSASYSSGAQVALTASAATGSVFAGWSGGGCSGTGTCTVTMSANQGVTATFNATSTFTLTVVTSGTGTGSVSSSPPGINCSGTCSHTYAGGTQVTLTASPDVGSYLSSWSACSGTGSCTVTVNQNLTVTATFNRVATAPLTGTWQGADKETAGPCTWIGTLTWVLIQDGTSLSGSFTDNVVLSIGNVATCGETLSASDTFQGSVNGTAIQLTGNYGETFSGNLSGNTINGQGYYLGVGTNPGVTSTFQLTKQ